jgi:DNA-binding XRE family transcriptional regulator
MKNHIKKYRERLGLSQERLSKMLDIRRETLSRFETGKGTPNLKTAMKISYLLDVEVNILWNYSPEKEINEKLIIKDVAPFQIIGGGSVWQDKQTESILSADASIGNAMANQQVSQTSSVVSFNDGYQISSDHGNALANRAVTNSSSKK